MIIFNNDLYGYSVKNVTNLYGITGKNCSQLSMEAVELLKHEYWLKYQVF